MKICFFHLKAYSVLRPESGVPVGGTLIQLFNVAKELTKDHQVYFITGDYGQPPVEKIENITVLKSTKVKRNAFNVIAAPFLIWKSLSKSNADVYITSSAGAETGIIALFCKIKGRKFIYRIAHDMDCTGNYIKQNGIAGRLFKFGLLNSSVVCQTESQASILKKNYNISAILIKNSFPIKFQINDKKENLLWVARCEKWKRPEIALSIAEALPQRKLTMICPKQHYQEQLFEEIVAQARKLSNVTFIDSVSPDEIQQYFNRARVFIGTSDHEGYPNTYIQAFLGATPIVSLNVDPDGIIQKNGVGYYADGNITTMISQINLLLDNDSIYNQSSSAAKAYVQKNHDINKNIELWKVAIG